MTQRHDRAALAFGHQAQTTLDELRVAFVGVGGLGAEVATMLRRISSARLVLIDPDNITESNLPRLPGTHPDDVGLPKAEVLGRLLDRGEIAPAAPRSQVVEEIDDRDLFDTDVIVVTADGAGPRAEVAIRARRYGYEGLLVFAAARIDLPTPLAPWPRLLGRVTVQGPQAPWCVVCAGVVDPNDAARELDVDDDVQAVAGYGSAATVASVAWWNTIIAGRTIQVIHEHTAELRPTLQADGLDWYLDGHDLLLVEHEVVGVSCCTLCSSRIRLGSHIQGLPPLNPWPAVTDEGRDAHDCTG